MLYISLMYDELNERYPLLLLSLIHILCSPQARHKTHIVKSENGLIIESINNVRPSSLSKLVSDDMMLPGDIS